MIQSSSIVVSKPGSVQLVYEKYRETMKEEILLMPN
jgi:hypothetical protein